ncbi:hypothetical protein CPB84DRAFT_1709727 [Gymnopilus junonius]|uniref:Uncharacterized protein n=1 Tax=Gymnopilus junonius TaxID=109634 RepID=A0A9P5TMF5_GYMJU|nr:hypothetical protein CPB84DRAFT_1709727 [Gymnopilus junonius]
MTVAMAFLHSGNSRFLHDYDDFLRLQFVTHGVWDPKLFDDNPEGLFRDIEHTKYREPDNPFPPFFFLYHIFITPIPHLSPGSLFFYPVCVYLVFLWHPSLVSSRSAPLHRLSHGQRDQACVFPFLFPSPISHFPLSFLGIFLSLFPYVLRLYLHFCIAYTGLSSLV